MQFLRPSIVGAIFEKDEFGEKDRSTDKDISDDLEEDLKKVLNDCWNEEESQRPDFAALKQSIKRFRRFEWIFRILNFRILVEIKNINVGLIHFNFSRLSAVEIIFAQ